MTVTFKRNGNITLDGNRVGVWSYEDVWASNGKYDKSGNRLVKGFWHAYLIDGKHLMCYQKFEIAQYVQNRWQEFYKIKRTLTTEQQQLNINNAK